MKKAQLLITMFILALTVNAQNAVAKIKYEQAEEAFLKNDFTNTLAKLDEAQQILGSTNPKILYLRLMAQKNIIAGGKYDYDFLTAARTDAAYYVKKYSDMQGIEEKFREVFEFSEALDALPKTKELFEQRKTEASQNQAEWAKARARQVSDSLIGVYRVKKCATPKEFQDYNLRAFIGLTKQKNKAAGITLAYINTWNQNSVTGPLQILFNEKGLYVYTYTVLGETDPATAKNLFQSLVNLYPPGLETTAMVKKEIIADANGNESGFVTFLPAATGNRGNIAIVYTNVNSKGNVTISFAPQAE
jgi:hypothetical protein